jgi:hypothetical protein
MTKDQKDGNKDDKQTTDAKVVTTTILKQSEKQIIKVKGTHVNFSRDSEKPKILPQKDTSE